MPAEKPLERALNLTDGEIERPEYEKGLINAINREVEEGDKIVIIGGGYGVSAVHASKKSGSEGSVKVFEGSQKQYEKLSKTIHYNEAPNIEPINQIVEVAGNLYDARGDSTVQKASNLEKCDMLIIDAEGAELDIIEKMEIRPDKLIVESHGVFNSSTAEVKALLEDIGYKIKSVEEAEEDPEVQAQDVKVITALSSKMGGLKDE